MINFFETLGNINIAEDQRDKFREMYMKVASAGGMMAVEEIKIFDKNFTLLAPIKIEDDGNVEISYNYFEDNWWETGVFNYEKGNVRNLQIGWRQFNIVSSALKLLAEFNSSTDGYTSKGRVLSLDILTGWLNYVLEKKYHLKKRRNALHMYEMMTEKYQNITMDDLCDELEPYRLCSQHELLSKVFTEMPVDEAIKFFENSDRLKQSERFVFSPGVMVAAARKAIKEWIDSDMPIEDQLPNIKKFLAKATELIVAGAEDWEEQNRCLPYSDAYIVVYMLGMDVFVKIFLYETGLVDDELAKYAATPLKLKKLDWMVPQNDKIPLPISTQELLCHKAPNDMAYWWQPDGDIVLTDEFWDILDCLKRRFQDIMENLQKESWLDVLSMMQKLTDIGTTCEELFKRPMIFKEFFYEMIFNSQSLENQALVKLLDNYVQEYGKQYKEEKENGKIVGFWGTANSQSYKMLKKLSAILANKNLRQHLLN